MKNTWIVVIVLILVVGGVVVFTGNKTAAPTVEEMGNMEGMTPTDIPAGYNTPLIPVADGVVREFVVDGKNFSFTPSKITVKKGEAVKIIFKNTQGFHDLVIDEYRVATKQIRTGEQETITFLADKTGSFEYYCSVGTHRAMGMTGTLVVE